MPDPISDPVVEILLVEDNPNDLELALHALQKHKVANRIHVARDGVEALEFFFGPANSADTVMDGTRMPIIRLPAVVLLDLKLPRVDGLEVLQRIKADPRTRMVPVVVMTASREENDIVESYNLGVNSYIVKPVDFAQFSETIRQLGMYWVLLNERPRL